MKKLTIYFPFYNQCEMLKKQLDNFIKYPKDILNRIYIIIVDDGSQNEKAYDIINNKKYLDKLNIKLLRINIDIPWNQPEANNFAFNETNTEYILRLDIDHYITIDNIKKILNFNPQKQYYYRFKRIKNKKLINPNPNIYLILKSNLDKVNGYNEYFSGNYGDDIEFLPRLNKVVKAKIIDNIILNINNNNKTHNLSRNLDINRKKLKEKNRPFYKNVHKSEYLYLINTFKNNDNNKLKVNSIKKSNQKNNIKSKKNNKIKFVRKVNSINKIKFVRKINLINKMKLLRKVNRISRNKIKIVKKK